MTSAAVTILNPAISPASSRRLPRLTAVQQFSLSSARLDLASSHLLKPRPDRCCYRNFRCTNRILFRIDGYAFCSSHSDLFWETEFVDEHHVEQI